MHSKTMKAAVLNAPSEIICKDVIIPAPDDNEIAIDVMTCGVCGSDIHMWKAGKGWNDNIDDFVMGHEFCGIVAQSNDSDFNIGDRVVFWANLYCGECHFCQSGNEQLCKHVDGKNYVGFVTNGGYAEKFVGLAKNAFKLPDSVSDISAALIDPLMVAYHAVRKSNIKLNGRVLVIGSGIIGHLIGELAKKSGASFVALSKLSDHKIKRAQEFHIFDAYFDAHDENSIAHMQTLTSGGFDIIFEAAGGESALDTCIKAIKPGGTVILIGNSNDEKIPVNINKLVLSEINFSGSVSCTRTEFVETIDLIAQGYINVEKYVTDILPLDKLQEAFERQISETDPMLKCVIQIG